jgi:hypothetical protein
MLRYTDSYTMQGSAMATHANNRDNPDEAGTENPIEQATPGARAEARKLRLASLRRVAGIWANRADIPADGLQYEQELRNEWR